jgi:hypothetical protein
MLSGAKHGLLLKTKADPSPAPALELRSAVRTRDRDDSVEAFNHPAKGQSEAFSNGRPQSHIPLRLEGNEYDLVFKVALRRALQHQYEVLNCSG